MSEDDRDIQAEAEETLAALVNKSEADPTFDTPWQARAFAITVALTERETYDWDRFQEHFIERIQSTDEAVMQRNVEQVYYEEWLATLEELLANSGTIVEEELDQRQAEFEVGDREASEFVVERSPEGCSSR